MPACPPVWRTAAIRMRGACLYQMPHRPLFTTDQQQYTMFFVILPDLIALGESCQLLFSVVISCVYFIMQRNPSLGYWQTIQFSQIIFGALQVFSKQTVIFLYFSCFSNFFTAQILRFCEHDFLIYFFIHFSRDDAPAFLLLATKKQHKYRKKQNLLLCPVAV